MLPQSWTRANLLEVSELVRGVTYSKGDATDSPTDNHMGVLRANNITQSGLSFSDLVYVPSGLVSELQRVRQNDIVIATSSGSISVVGKAARATSDFNVGFGAFCGLIRPSQEIEARFLGHFFGSSAYRTYVSSVARGVNINNLKREHFENIEIPLPPLPEQVRIADKLDALLARVEAGRERLERVPKLLKRFRQSVLSAAVSGELTREWRGGRDAEWRTARVGDTFVSFSGGTPSRNQSDYWGGDVGWLSSGDIKSTKIADSSESITQLGLQNSSAKIAKAGSIIVVVRSGILAHTLPVAVVERDLAINQDIKCFDSNNKNINLWLLIAWKANESKILGQNRDGTTVQSVKYDTLKNWVLSIPPQDEFNEAIRRIESLSAIADRIEAKYAAALSSFDRLTPALLAKAFRGELVPQDPNDEPASVLLERIRAAREAEGGKRGRGRPAKAAAGGSGDGAEVKRRGRPPGANAQAGAEGTEPKRRGRPPKVREAVSEPDAQPAAVAETAEASAAPRGRGRPPGPGIPQASSFEDALRKLEEQKLARAQGARQVGLFDDAE
ncbi:restriction endonuclease subunit S [Deinococcus soli (ex Cha et al. 2016)]|nr:restriction endonuclease subunit S [Deinococcus soli (ex Cha et al. 2016)]